MSINRELSQLASFIDVQEDNNFIGISTGGTYTVGIGTSSVIIGSTGIITATQFQGPSGSSLIDRIDLQDEGSLVGTGFTTLNFVGTGVTITEGASGIATVTIVGTALAGTSGEVDVTDNNDGTTTLSLPNQVAITSSLTVGTVKIESGIITATSGIVTYYGNQVIGTPAGGFKSGAFTINNTDHTKDSINELNFILGKLVPTAPDTFNGLSLSLTGTGTAYLCQGFTPTNNTGGAAPSAGSAYTRNSDNTITSSYINDVGPGDNGTVTGTVNSTDVGSITFDSNTNNGTDGGIQVNDNKDASNSTRNSGITANFYQVYDVRFINATSPDGYNKAFFTHGSATTNEVFWYEDPSTVAAPIITFSDMTTPSPGSQTLNYSSGVPHYTESTNNNFTYVASVENATGDMYSYSDYKLLNSDGQTTGFSNPGHKYYNNFNGGTHPPARNYGVGTGVTTLITQTPRNIHDTITSNHFTTFDAITPYGSDLNERISFSTNVNIMGTTATTSKIDEDNILISSLGTGSGNATRVNAGSTGDNPTPVFTSWTKSSSVAAYESVVRGGVLRHDQTDYSSGYLPAGPDYSSGRTGAQYFQMELIRSQVSQFNISVTGSYGGCWVCMPDNSTWTTSLSGTNGWADMFVAYRDAGIPTSGEPGCSTGGLMSGTSGTFTCTFGTESSSNDSNNRILIRWRLDSGDSITAMSFSAT